MTITPFRGILFSLCLLFILTGIRGFTQKATGTHTSNNFLWGVATAAYQVEGAYQADGKGESKWDFLTNKVGVTQFVIGEKQTGNVAANMYDRTQYLKDIQLLKQLGVNAYRFSLDWSRIIPDGTGAVNEKALAHYDRLIDDVIAAGLEPVVTLYHFDYPVALLHKGGWGNPDMIKWYTNYASVVLKRYGKKVKKFITFNEPYIEFYLVEYMLNLDQSKEPANVRYAIGMQKAHRQLLANAAVTKMYHNLNLGGSIGITLNLSPCVPMDGNNPADVKATVLQDALLNRLFLDPLFKGTYPKQAMDSIRKYDPQFQPSEEEMNLIAANKPDFLGINFYAPAFVKYNEQAPMSTSWMDNNPDSVKAHSGPVRPEYLYQLLMQLKSEYGNPVTMITENGAGFAGEDIKDGNTVKDSLRADYIKRHIDAALKAKREGAQLKGYMVWSGWDNFEWVFGYSKRFGIIYVDFTTQQRTPKQSFYTYQRIIQQAQVN
ncbi:family 1 glycosylhydrolase [Chitinophagaceae bacterium LB-8]|uniref:Family 1 glycosylhydrolase n=1 Tax=Paraflavisolibacter caeni TaxID=2982496 RepID=A0A9X2XW36_9BACT|nr:family 1 glycosylhydrolase [Paraflavisolibacter caeni]MCU7549717.1 family 1 glycosylhydrolase [Paraflavisolibacter caeni]